MGTAISAALPKLTPSERDIARWHFSDHRSMSEIAGWLRMSPRQVKRRVSALRRKLAAAGVTLPPSPREPGRGRIMQLGAMLACL